MTKGRPAVRVALASIALGVLGVGHVVADELRGYVEFTLSDFESRREDDAGQVTENTADAFEQRYNLDFSKLLYPNLSLRAGGFFEHDSTTFGTNLTDTEGTTTKTRPYIDLALQQPFNTFEVSYNRSEDQQRTEGGPKLANVRETYSATMAYFPADLPRFRLEYLRTNAYDDSRLLQDATEDRFQLSSDYAPSRALQLQYRGSLENATDRLNDTEVQTWSHSGRVAYSNSFWNRRLYVSSDYNVSYNSIETTTSGGGRIAFPVVRIAGLSSINDLPELGALDPNPALVDGNHDGSAGVNLLIPQSGGDDHPRNIGLQLAGSAEVNALLLTADQDLTDVFDRFAWTVWTSADNENWSKWAAPDDPDPERHPLVTFDAFLKRFEIEFPTVNTEFVKLVVSPVRPSALLPFTFPTIAVTELEAELRRDAADVEHSDRSTSQILNFQTRTRLINRPAVYHELTYLLAKSDPNPSAFTLSDGFSLDHAFNPVYRVTARLAREVGRQAGEDRDAWIFGASLIANAIDTLRHRLVFSARKADEFGETRDGRSVFLFNSARLYRGIDVDLGLGRSITETDTSGTIKGHEIDANATFTPHRSMTVNLGYRDRTDDVAATPGGPSTPRYTRSGEVRVAYSPLVSLYLFGSYRIERQTSFDRRTIGNYSVSWSPFRDGTLQLGLYYNERLRSEDNAEERNFSPRLRWNFRRGSFLDVAYQKFTTRAITQRVDDEVVSSNLRFAF